MGRFQPGQQKPPGSGRKRGSRNKRSESLIVALTAVGLNVPEKLAETLPLLPVEKRADLLTDLMSYLYPKRKAVEVTEIRDPEPPPLEAATEEAALHRIENLREGFKFFLQTDPDFQEFAANLFCTDSYLKQVLEKAATGGKSTESPQRISAQIL